MAQFKYISNIDENDLEENIVIPCIDEEGYSCILIKNSLPKTLIAAYSTDNLEIKLNRVLTRNEKEYFFHVIKAKKIDGYSKNQFSIIFEYVFRKIENPIDDVNLASLIISLEDFFKTTPESNKRSIQIGVYGELLTIKYLFDIGYTDIIECYHENFYSKHDVEIDKNRRLEIKATTSEKRIHHFKHNQLMRTDVDVFVSSVMLEEVKDGLSLLELFEMVSPLFKNPDSKFALEKLKIKCGLIDGNEGMKFSYQKALNDIRFYNSVDLPKIQICSFDGISNIEYDVDFSGCDPIVIQKNLQ